ncbi:hypothetical protein D3C80_1681330 [compost metagenome]
MSVGALILASKLIFPFKKLFKNKLFLFLVGHIFLIFWFLNYGQLGMNDSIFISSILTVFAYFTSDLSKYHYTLVFIAYGLVVFKVSLVFIEYVGDFYEKAITFASNLPFN